MPNNLPKFPSTYKATLLYDGHCSICKKVKKIIEFVDFQKKIRQIDLWNADSYPEFKNFKIESLAKEIHLITKTGKTYKGYFAFKQVAKTIWAFSLLYILSFIPGADFLGQKVYKFISENRYLFNCESCGRLYCKIHAYK